MRMGQLKVVLTSQVRNGTCWFCGVVVITSALHAEGREFEPRQNLTFTAGENEEIHADVANRICSLYKTL